MAWSMALGLMVALALMVGARADDKKEDKEVTLKGKICCAKCELKEEGRTKCATVIVVKEDDKEVTYYFDKDSDKKNHKKICTEAKNGKVTGTVEEKDGKKWVKATKVEFDD
jgi:hypothetical protein